MNVVCNLRGTSGSGKSTIVRALMDKYSRKEPQFISGRKQPLSYKLYREDGNPLYVVGHYEQPTGGADSISLGMDYIYGMVNGALESGFDCILEGLVVASDVTRCAALHPKYKLLVIELNTPIDVCLDGIRSRRAVKAAAKGVDPLPVNPDNTIAKMKQLVPQRKRFKAAGVDFRYINREEALNAVLQHFGWIENLGPVM